MDYNKRIDDNFLKADYVDGEVLQHTDMNELESVVKLGVNANYEDIQKIQDGTISVENSNKLSGATLSKVSSETLQNSDVKVPTSAQVKQYIDSAISSIDLTGYASEVFVENEIADTVEIYDSNGNGIVDNAEKVNNHTVDKDVPSDAKFTDTIYDDTEVRGLISDLDDDKVDKVTGKGLSTNDFTNTYKTKLDGIANNAQVNVIEKVKVNGTQQSVSSKAVDISVPTQLSQLSDDSTHRLVTDTEKTTWNNKADISDIPSLTNYVKNTDYANSNKGGVFKTLGAYGTVVDGNGYLLAGSYTYPQYENIYDTSFISKGTLENVITGKNLETADNKVTEITESSTDTEYPSAKAVYDFASGGAEEEEIEALREEDEYLNSVIEQLPRDEATGTNVTLQPTIQARMKMSLAPSEMTQHSYSGKNLLPNELTSQEINGLTVGVDSNGVVSISGTANAQTILSLYLNAQSTITVPSGTCYLSTNLGGTVTGGSNPAWFKILGTNNVTQSMDITDADGMSFSVASDWNLAIGQIICQESQTFTNVKIYPMVSTSSDTTYEPYVGGTATPSPSYPEEIHTISGNNSVVVEGKNLFDYTKHTALALNNEGMITTTKYYTVDDLVTYKLKPNTKYTFSFKNADMELTTNNFAMAINGSWVQTNSGKYSVTTDSNGEFTCKMGASAYPNIGLASLYIQLEEGNQVTTYEPYVSQTAQLNLGNIEYCKIGNYEDKFILTSGSNLFDKDNANILDNVYMGTSTLGTSNGAKTLYISCKPSTTYTISRRAGQRFIVGDTITTPASGVSVSNRTADNTGTSITITTSANAQYLVVFYYLSSVDTLTEQAILDSIMINLGNTALPYEPYGTNQWYIKKNIGKVVLDGSETYEAMNWGSEHGEAWRTAINNMKLMQGSTTEKLLYSNLFTYYAGSVLNTTEKHYGMTNRNNQAQVVLKYPEATSASNFAQWVSTHNVIIYYPLEVPTYTQITGTLETQLENIYKNMLSYKGTTNVSQISNDLPFVLGVSAMKDINAMISELTNAIIELGGE